MSGISCLLGIFLLRGSCNCICCVFCVVFFGVYCFVVIGYDLFYIRHTSVT